MPNRVRAFLALRLSAEVERALADFAESLRSAHPHGDAIRWVRRANLHLTLRFLGDRVEASTLERLDHALARIAAGTACFTIGVRGVGGFPNLSRPRVLWAGLQSGELVALAGGIERSAVASGLPAERRAYSPHLTIGRVRDLGGWDQLRPAIEAAADRDFGRSAVQSMVLYRSMLAVDAASYEELARYPFAAAA
jgi:2'-5' RNA ligase